jgi:hypothetical protein
MAEGRRTACMVRVSAETKRALELLSSQDGITQGECLGRLASAELERRAVNQWYTSGKQSGKPVVYQNPPVTTGDHTDGHSAQAVEVAALSTKLEAVTRERDRAWSDLEAARADLVQARQDLAHTLDANADMAQAMSAQAQAHAIAQAAARPGLAERLRRRLGRS